MMPCLYHLCNLYIKSKVISAFGNWFYLCAFLPYKGNDSLNQPCRNNATMKSQARPKEKDPVPPAQAFSTAPTTQDEMDVDTSVAPTGP